MTSCDYEYNSSARSLLATSFSEWMSSLARQFSLVQLAVAIFAQTHSEQTGGRLSGQPARLIDDDCSPAIDELDDELSGGWPANFLAN